MTTVGTNIKQRREELGLTQEELAKKMGYKSKSTINKIEAGINDITQSKVVAFSKVLETTPATLMGWDETFVSRLRDRRRELGLSVEDIANYLNVDEKEVEKWEIGITDTLIQNKEYTVLLADILHVSPFYILGADVSLDLVNNLEALEFYLNSNNKKSAEYTADEILLIGKYRILNDIGKKKIQENIEDLTKIYSIINNS